MLLISHNTFQNVDEEDEVINEVDSIPEKMEVAESESSYPIVEEVRTESQKKIQYLQINYKSALQEITRTNQFTPFVEKEFRSGSNISLVTLVDNYEVEMSPAKDALIPLFNIYGNYGKAKVKEEAKIEWDGDKAYRKKFGSVIIE